MATCAIGAGNIPALFEQGGTMKYEKPAVQRLGSLRELTLGTGPNTPGDATNLYHRS
jgi:hypothetical protein